MNATFARVAVKVLTAALAKLGGAGADAAAAGAPSLGPLGKILALLPTNDLVALIEGEATIDTDLDLAIRAAQIVKSAFPPAALTAGEVELGLRALKLVLDLAGVGGTPVKGGVPPWYPAGGGPSYINGR